MAKFFWLFLIIVLAIVLRVWQLDMVPPALFGDELDVGYHAYSILNTGRDYFGQFLPTYIHSLAEWRAPLFIYSAVPFVWIFGLNEIGVRGSAIFFGVIDILLLYLLVKELFEKRGIALLAALFLAISPWHLHYSRAAFEVTLLLALFLGGVLFFLKGLKKPPLLVISAVLFALSPYTYSTANLFLPLFLLSLVIIFKNKILILNKKWLVISCVIALVVLLPFTKSLISGEASHRISIISIFSTENVDNEINFKGGQQAVMERFFHNKATVWGKIFVTNYLTAFSPQFLFLTGDQNPRQSVGGMGELYLIFLPLLLVGLWYGLENLKKQSMQLIFFWLLISPIPSALTQGGGTHATRLFLMLPPLVILIAIGLFYLWEIKNKFFKVATLTVAFVFLVLQIIFYLHQYHVHFAKESWRFWQYGYKDLITYIGKNQNDYDRVFINNTYEPSLLRFLFWTEYNPRNFQKKFAGDIAQENIVPGFNGFKLDKFYFGTLNKEGNFGEVLDQRTLYLVSQKEEVPGDWDWSKNPPSDLKVLLSVKNPLGEPLFYLVTGK